MISNQDFARYLREMLELESKMQALYRETAGRVSDPGIKKAFLELADEEAGHAKAIQAMREMGGL